MVFPRWAAAGIPFMEASASLTAWKRRWRSQMATPTAELLKSAFSKSCGSPLASLETDYLARLDAVPDALRAMLVPTPTCNLLLIATLLYIQGAITYRYFKLH